MVALAGARMNEDQVREAVKKALKEWLDEKFVEVGKWTVGGLVVALLGAAVTIILWADGWRK